MAVGVVSVHAEKELRLMSEKKNVSRAKQIYGFSIGLIASFVWGTILWLFAISSEMWVSHTITMTIAIIGTLLWTVGLIAICRLAVGTWSSCKNYSTLVTRDI
jgi:hypothetical protein